MANFTLRHDSLEYLPVRVEGFRAGEIYDPTVNPVHMALPVVDVEPVVGDWKIASWETVDVYLLCTYVSRSWWSYYIDSRRLRHSSQD